MLLICLLTLLFQSTFAVNDIDKKYLSIESMCLAKLRETLNPNDVAKRTLDGIVGVGWDDLISEATYPVLASNFSECRTTPDGAFLIPNGVLAIPILNTRVDRMAEYFRTFEEVKTGLKKMHSIGGGISYGVVSIGGSFSQIHEETKTNIYQFESSMLVTKLVHEAYIIIADASVGSLSADFRSRLNEIADAITEKLPYRVEYLAEMVARDFGTHVVLKSKTGAIIEEQIYIEQNDTFMRKETLDSMRAAASASFMGKISIGVNAAVGREVTSDEKKSLSHITRHSLTRTMGGPTVNHMLGGDGINNTVFAADALVGFQSDGLPLSELVNANHFPDMAKDTLLKLREAVENAIKKYYEMNTIRGCTDINSPNFNFKANVDDGSCKPSNDTYDFGGVYQACEVLPELPGSSTEQSTYHPFNCSKFTCAYITPKYRCEEFAQANYFTGGESCPQNYEPVPIATVKHAFPDRVEEHSTSHCHSYFVVGKKCSHPKWNVVYKDQIKLSSFWCRKKANVTLPPETGVMFGGLYKKGSINIFTGENGCPATYNGYNVAEDVIVCLGRDYQLGHKYAIPFGGFFSCQTPESHRRCPKGYSQHLATINNNCGIYYCVRPEVFKRFEPAILKRPPFIDSKLALSNYTRSSLEMYKFGELMLRIPVLDIAKGLADEKRYKSDNLLLSEEHQNILPHSEVVTTVNEFIKAPVKSVSKLAQTDKDYHDDLEYFEDIFNGKIPPPNMPHYKQIGRISLYFTFIISFLYVILV